MLPEHNISPSSTSWECGVTSTPRLRGPPPHYRDAHKLIKLLQHFCCALRALCLSPTRLLQGDPFLFSRFTLNRDM